jgi:hypothetical protein
MERVGAAAGAGTALAASATTLGAVAMVGRRTSDR